ncbi:MAG: hypothetical protein KDD62_05525 [Bdellovibrionales bacterium]|nr:hypothetical protein [Bdellovibrionales bacterium]
MKHIIYLILIAGSIVVTYKVSFEMIQAETGSLFLHTYVANHKIHARIAEAMESGDTQKAKALLDAMSASELEFVQSLLPSLEHGSFGSFAKSETERARRYLDEISSSKPADAQPAS